MDAELATDAAPRAPPHGCAPEPRRRRDRRFGPLGLRPRHGSYRFRPTQGLAVSRRPHPNRSEDAFGVPAPRRPPSLRQPRCPGRAGRARDARGRCGSTRGRETLRASASPAWSEAAPLGPVRQGSASRRRGPAWRLRAAMSAIRRSHRRAPAGPGRPPPEQEATGLEAARAEEAPPVGVGLLPAPSAAAARRAAGRGTPVGRWSSGSQDGRTARRAPLGRSGRWSRPRRPGTRSRCVRRRSSRDGSA
jgi:hypothetical protein